MDNTPNAQVHGLGDVPDWFLQELDKRTDLETNVLRGAMSYLAIELLQTQDAVRKHNCFYCGHFDRGRDVCLIAKPPSKPPTFILVHGCRQFWPADDIPF